MVEAVDEPGDGVAMLRPQTRAADVVDVAVPQGRLRGDQQVAQSAQVELALQGCHTESRQLHTGRHAIHTCNQHHPSKQLKTDIKSS